MDLSGGFALRPALLHPIVGVPYAFAHPAAVVPVAKLLGARAVPSALVIGSMIPDAWYFVPGVGRGESHSILGVLWFCLPVGLLVYVAFHLVFKEPALALLPRNLAGRLAVWSAARLPAVSWRYVVASMLAGIVTHLVWDAFTHRAYLPLPLQPSYRVLQHGSTIAGTLFLLWWLWRKLARTPSCGGVPELNPAIRTAVITAMLVVPSAAFVSVLHGLYGVELRTAVRAAGVAAVSTFGVLALVFALAWKRLTPHLARNLDHKL